MLRRLDASFRPIPRYKSVLRVESVNVTTGTEKMVEYAVSRLPSDPVALSMHPDPPDLAVALG